MDIYSYSGPVMEFDVVRDHKWTGKTRAPSKAKAMSNLTFQYKNQLGLIPGIKISLDPNGIVLEKKGVC